MIGARLGHIFDKPFKKLALHIKLSPNVISFIGFIVTLFACYILLYDLRIAGFLILFGGIFDILDGVVARTNGKESRFGAFFDSVIDRYSDACILIAISWTFVRSGNYRMFWVSMGCLTGSLLVSYVRARAEGLGINCRQGLMERPERVVLIAAGAISGFLAHVLWILLFLTHITVLQRILLVRRASQHE